jgi:hypothetical protein
MTQSIYIKRLAIVLTALAFALVALMPAIAGAHGNNEDEDHHTTSQERVEERQAKAQARIEARQARLEEREAVRQERRQAACERRLERINAVMDNLSRQASNHLIVFNRFYDRVQEFYDSGQLTVSNYGELKAAADASKDAAALEIEALVQLDVEVDCTDPEVAVKVGAFKDSAEAARDALKTYRKSLVELISSMRAEAAEQNAQNKPEDENEGAEEGSGQEETEGIEAEEGTGDTPEGEAENGDEPVNDGSDGENETEGQE